MVDFQFDDLPEIPESTLNVVLPCNGEYANTESVQFEDIEEDIQGRDIMTFTCPACGETHKSYILG